MTGNVKLNGDSRRRGLSRFDGRIGVSPDKFPEAYCGGLDSRVLSPHFFSETCNLTAQFVATGLG